MGNNAVLKLFFLSFGCVCAAPLTSKLLWHRVLAFGHIAGEPVEQEGALVAHVRPGGVTLTCFTRDKSQSARAVHSSTLLRLSREEISLEMNHTDALLI